MRTGYAARTILFLSKSGEYIMYSRDEYDSQYLMYALYTSEDMNTDLSSLLFGE